ncbi:MAG: hypothetical protein M3150_05100 [Pseudomonadota bacterium]|nr:hypothetical protein [Pseudomonadota bacterium]
MLVAAFHHRHLVEFTAGESVVQRRGEHLPVDRRQGGAVDLDCRGAGHDLVDRQRPQAGSTLVGAAGGGGEVLPQQLGGRN